MKHDCKYIFSFSCKVLVRGTKRQVATLRSRKVDHKKSNSGSSRNNRAVAAAKAVDNDDDVTDSVTAAAGSKFHNRTLQIFLHEMRAALEQEVVEKDGKKTYRVHKILDDLEYVAQNMSNGSPASAAMPMKAAATGQNICFLCKVNQVSQNPS